MLQRGSVLILTPALELCDIIKAAWGEGAGSVDVYATASPSRGFRVRTSFSSQDEGGMENFLENI